jgi:hypothetical protein
MSFNAVFFAALYDSNFHSDNQVSMILFNKLKNLCHHINKTNVYDKLLLLADEVFNAYDSGLIPINDEQPIYAWIKVAMRHHRSIRDRVQWYRDIMPTVATIATSDELIALRTLIISEAIYNEYTDGLLVQINYALTTIDGLDVAFAAAC